MRKTLPPPHCLHDAPICCDTCSSVLHHRDVACATTSYSQHSISICGTLGRYGCRQWDGMCMLQVHSGDPAAERLTQVSRGIRVDTVHPSWMYDAQGVCRHAAGGLHAAQRGDEPDAAVQQDRPPRHAAGRAAAPDAAAVAHGEIPAVPDFRSVGAAPPWLMPISIDPPAYCNIVAADC